MPRERVSGLTLFMWRLRCDVTVAILVVCCLARATAAAEAAITSSEASQADALAGLNDKLDRLTSKLESLTHQVEDFVDAGRQERGGPVGPPAARVEVGRGVGQIDDQRGGTVRQADAESDLYDGSVEGEGQKKQEDRNGEEDGSSDGGTWGWARDGRRFGPAWLVVATFVHEVWLLLQHANILLNPLCQRLDRSYGIGLLRRRLYWVIAGVLAAYWSREVLSMLIASPYASPLTLKMVAISSLYHVGKIILISLDAQRRWSPTMGIMRLLMDHWHMSSFKDVLLCLKRMSLQGFDTATHALIVRDMVRWDEESAERTHGLHRKLIVVSVVWAMHAIANLVTRVSTATLVVEVAKSLVGNWGSPSGKRPPSWRQRGGGMFGALDGGRAEFTCTTSCSHGHKSCEVCHLLTRDKPAASAPPPHPTRKRVD
ncbi:unnamed protein product [Ectocarpus sp. 6 AP-2014]